MRTALLLGILAPIASAPDSLQLGVEAGTKITKSFTSSLKLELQSVVVEVNGEEQEQGDTPEVTILDEEEIVFVDEYVSIDDGKATELVRTYETLNDVSSQVVVAPDGEEESTESEGESGLEGVGVRFQWSEDDGEYEVAFADEDEQADDELLENLDADADFLFLMPEDDVDVGDTWEIDVQAFHYISNPSGDLKIDSDDEDGDRGNEFSDQFRDNLSGELEGKLVSIEDGVATIKIIGDVETTVETEQTPDGAPEGVEITQAFQFSFECEGTLTWDMEKGHALNLEFGGAVALEIVNNQSQGEDFQITFTQDFEGEYESTADFN